MPPKEIIRIVIKPDVIPGNLSHRRQEAALLEPLQSRGFTSPFALETGRNLPRAGLYFMAASARRRCLGAFVRHDALVNPEIA